MTRVRSITALAIVLLAITQLAGCATGFVEDAARGSIASFLNNVVSTAVNETINP